MQVCYQTLKPSGIQANTGTNQICHATAESTFRVGVFVGFASGEYGSMSNRPEPGVFTITGSHAAIASNRVSFVLGLEGPSASVDTACSSALVAVDMARSALCSGACAGTVVATANVLLSPGSFVGICRAHMLSPVGRCKTVSLPRPPALHYFMLSVCVAV